MVGIGKFWCCWKRRKGAIHREKDYILLENNGKVSEMKLCSAYC